MMLCKLLLLTQLFTLSTSITRSISSLGQSLLMSAIENNAHHRRTIVIGDVHGCYDELKLLLKVNVKWWWVVMVVMMMLVNES